MALGPSPLHARLRACAPTLPFRIINRCAALLANPLTSPDTLLIVAEALEDCASEAKYWTLTGPRADGLEALAAELRAGVHTRNITPIATVPRIG